MTDIEMMAAISQACLSAAVAMGAEIKGLSWHGKNFVPMSVDHPGSFIAEELSSRGWDVSQLALTSGVDIDRINLIIAGGADITLDLAVALGDAFDVPHTFLENLQELHNIYKGRSWYDQLL